MSPSNRSSHDGHLPYDDHRHPRHHRSRPHRLPSVGPAHLDDLLARAARLEITKAHAKLTRPRSRSLSSTRTHSVFPDPFIEHQSRELHRYKGRARSPSLPPPPPAPPTTPSSGFGPSKRDLIRTKWAQGGEYPYFDDGSTVLLGNGSSVADTYAGVGEGRRMRGRVLSPMRSELRQRQSDEDCNHGRFDYDPREHLKAEQRARARALADAKTFEQEKVLSPFGTEVLQDEVERRWKRENDRRARWWDKMQKALERGLRVEMISDDEIKVTSRRKTRLDVCDLEGQRYERYRRNKGEENVRVERFKYSRH